MMRDMRQILLFADNLLLSLPGLCFIPVEAWASRLRTVHGNRLQRPVFYRQGETGL